MSVQVQTIYNRVRTQLIDNGVVLRWSNQELINWICDGQRAIVLIAPRASATLAVMKMQPGTRQNIPAGGWMFLTCYRNMGADGMSPGIVPLKQARILMDTQYPGWHAATPVSAPNTFVFDPSDPTAFYVSGPSDGTGYLEVNYSAMPVDRTNPTDLIQVQDIYQTPLFDYCMWRAQQKDSDFAAGQAAAAQYFTSFAGLLGNLGKDVDTENTIEGKT